MPPQSHLPTQKLNTITSHTGPINTLAFSNKGGTYILTGSSDRSIHLSRTEPSSSSSITSPSPSSSSSSKPSSTPTSSSPIQRYTSHGYPLLSLSISPQNTHFASTSTGDRSLFYWDIQSPSSTVRRLGANTSQQHTARVNCVTFAGEGGDALLVSGSDDRSVRCWDLRSRDNRPVVVLEEARDGVSAVVVPSSSASTGAEIIAGSTDGRVRTYDIRTGRCTVDVYPGPVTDLNLTRDGRCLLVSSLDGDGKIRFMDRSDGTCLRVFPDSASSSSSMSAAEVERGSGYKNTTIRLQCCLGGANEDLVLSGSESDGKVKAWDVLSGTMVDEVEVSEVGKVVSVVKWRDGSGGGSERKHVWAAGGADGVVRVYGM